MVVNIKYFGWIQIKNKIINPKINFQILKISEEVKIKKKTCQKLCFNILHRYTIILLLFKVDIITKSDYFVFNNGR